MTTINSVGRAITETITCPDCDAETRTIEVASGITIMQVFHDDTCPTYLHMEATA